MDWLCRVSAQRYPAGMELSAELVACILYFVPLSPAKLAMQGVSRSFRKAMRTTQAHAGNTEVTFPLQASHPPCISRDILRVMPLVCLAPEQKDFSWVAFLEHLQELACEYGALQPVSPLQTMQKLTLDCIVSYKRHRQRFMYNKKISLDYLFPNLKQLYLHSIPQEDVVHGQQSEKHFLKDIQLMSLQCVVLDNYPYQCMPLLAQNPKWATLDISVNSMPFGNQMPLTESCVPASTADIVTSLHLQDIDIDSLDLNEFARIERLALGQELGHNWLELGTDSTWVMKLNMYLRQQHSVSRLLKAATELAFALAQHPLFLGSRQLTKPAWELVH